MPHIYLIRLGFYTSITEAGIVHVNLYVHLNCPEIEIKICKDFSQYILMGNVSIDNSSGSYLVRPYTHRAIHFIPES